MSDFMRKPCVHCPYRRDVKPFLRPERGEELAYLTENPYNEFWCHKTTEHDEDSDDGDRVAVETSKLCAGFLSMQVNAGADCPDGFKPSDLVYSDAWEMVDAYSGEDA